MGEIEIGEILMHSRTRRRAEYLGMGKTKAPTYHVKWEDGTESTLPADQFTSVDTTERIPSGPIYAKVLKIELRKKKTPALWFPAKNINKHKKRVEAAIVRSLSRPERINHLAERIARDRS